MSGDGREPVQNLPVGIADHHDRLRTGDRESGRGHRVGARGPGGDDDGVGHDGGMRCGHGDLLRWWRAFRAQTS